MLLATDWAASTAGLPDGSGRRRALPISGVFEVEPLLPTSLGTALDLTPAQARALSPRWLPSPGRPLHAVVGGAKVRNSCARPTTSRPPGAAPPRRSPGANHFTVLDPLTDPAIR